MGFLDSLGSLIEEVGKMNTDAQRDAVTLTTEELCYKVNHINALTNPLIWTNCNAELARRAKDMKNSEVIGYYNEYSDYAQKDAANVFAEELKKRGYEIEE